MSTPEHPRGVKAERPAERALFKALFDDAAVFPPELAPLPRAISDHVALQASSYADLVGPLLLPVAAVEDFVQLKHPPIAVTLIGRPGTELSRVVDALFRLGGETGTTIVFFKMLECGLTQRAANDEPGRKVIPLIRSFTVFNAAQIDGLPRVMTTRPVAPEGWTPILAAEQLLERSGAVLRHGGDRAFYRPSDDIIQMPPRIVFPDAGHYYATALHELTHWTGAPSRCNRELRSRQHIEAYAFEELVAEMGAAFLSNHCGLPGELQHASYIAHWLAALRNDKRLIFTAASLAQKAADYLLPPQKVTPNPEAAVIAA